MPIPLPASCKSTSLPSTHPQLPQTFTYRNSPMPRAGGWGVPVFLPAQGHRGTKNPRPGPVLCTNPTGQNRITWHVQTLRSPPPTTMNICVYYLTGHIQPSNMSPHVSNIPNNHAHLLDPPPSPKSEPPSIRPSRCTLASLPMPRYHKSHFHVRMLPFVPAHHISQLVHGAQVIPGCRAHPSYGFRTFVSRFRFLFVLLLTFERSVWPEVRGASVISGPC